MNKFSKLKHDLASFGTVDYYLLALLITGSVFAGVVAVVYVLPPVVLSVIGVIAFWVLLRWWATS